MNSREKGKRGERAWRDELRAAGYDARRGQQFSGSPDSRRGGHIWAAPGTYTLNYTTKDQQIEHLF
jgi:hypothetical protein